MAIISTFDGVHKRLILGTDNVSGGILAFNAADLLSEIIKWRNGPSSSPYNDRFIRPIRAAGGDSKGDGKRVGTTSFLMNDWQIGFPDQSLLVQVEGELLLDQATNTNGQRFYYGNLSPTSRIAVEFQTPTFNEIVEVSSNGVISSTFTNNDRATLNQINSNIDTLLERTFNLMAGLGRIPGVSATQKNPTDNEPGYLRTSDGTINQSIARNPDDSVTIENVP